MPSVTVRPSASGYCAYLWAFRRFRGMRLSAAYQPVPTRLQYIRGSQLVAKMRLATFASAAVLPSYHTVVCKLDQVPPFWDVDFGKVPACVRNLDRGFGSRAAARTRIAPFRPPTTTTAVPRPPCPRRLCASARGWR